MRLEKLGKKLEEGMKEDGQVGKEGKLSRRIYVFTARAVNLDRSSGEVAESKGIVGVKTA